MDYSILNNNRKIIWLRRFLKLKLMPKISLYCLAIDVVCSILVCQGIERSCFRYYQVKRRNYHEDSCTCGADSGRGDLFRSLGNRPANQ